MKEKIFLIIFISTRDCNENGFFENLTKLNLMLRFLDLEKEKHIEKSILMLPLLVFQKNRKSVNKLMELVLVSEI